ncbi:unnamed protein product, partial [Phaeothamnion confervicola]
MGILAQAVRAMTKEPPGHRTSKQSLRKTGLAILVAALATVLFRGQQLFREVTEFPEGTTEGCKLLAPHVEAVEDMARISDSIVLGSSDDRSPHFFMATQKHLGPDVARPGAIYAFVFGAGPSTDPPQVFLPLLGGFPSGVAFHPHGIYYHAAAKELYVVNHAYRRGGERIDVISV